MQVPLWASAKNGVQARAGSQESRGKKAVLPTVCLPLPLTVPATPLIPHCIAEADFPGPFVWLAT